MFNKRKLEMLQGVQVTSKASLKLQFLYIAKGNVKEAKELYEFFSSDMESLPDHDPVQPTFLDNTKETVNGIMSWIKENQDTLAKGIDFIRGFKAPVPKEPLPPIN